MLTDKTIKNLQAKSSPYSLSDGEGLAIEVLPSGKKKWTLSYRIHGKQSRKRLGDYPQIGCKQARQLARQYKAELATQKIRQPTLQAVITEWLTLQKPTWTSQKYTDTVVYRLHYLSHHFAHKCLDDISRQDIATALKPIIAKGTLETAMRSLRLLRAVFQFAIISGYTDKNPCLLTDKLIPRHTPTHHPCLPVKDMPEFFRRLRHLNAYPTTKIALLLVCYTGVRVSELLHARFDTGELDLDNALWVIPAHRMKTRKALKVPLAPTVLALFTHLYNQRKNDGYIFKHKNTPNLPMTSNAILGIIKKMGFGGQMTTHGFRALFSTHANESGLFRPIVIEHQIAHTGQNTTAKAYNRAEYWQERVALMHWYAHEVDDWIGKDFWQEIINT